MRIISKNLSQSRIGRLFILLPFLLTTFLSFAQQLNVSGVVLNFNDLSPLTDVHVFTRRTGTYTNSEGKFTLLVQPNDTLFFSRIGYRLYTTQITIDQSVLSVLLKEESTTLDTLLVYAPMDLKIPQLPRKTVIEGLYKYEKERLYSENRYLPRHSGLGFSMAAPWYYLSKEQKTKRKLNRYRVQNQSTAIYTKFIMSDSLKSELCAMFKITETEFYKKLEVFTKKFPEAAFLKSENEIMELLIQSFATKEEQGD
jgi:CarboxypepD_reg-like domain